MKKTFLYVTLIFVLGQSFLYSEPSAQDYYQQIVKTGFFDEKIEAGKKIGRLGSETARQGLILALNDDSYWNRAAGVWGLILFPDAETATLLLEKMYDDHMIDDYIQEAFTKNSATHINTLIAQFEKNPEAKKQQMLIDIIGQSPTPQAEAFLKKTLENTKSPYRGTALHYLSQNFPAGNYSFIRAYLDDPQLQSLVLRHMIFNGTEKELPVFVSMVKNSKNEESVIISYQGIAKWGDTQLKESTFLNALSSDNPSFQQGALYAFHGIRSNPIRDQLCRLTKNGQHQSIRLDSALQLADFRDKVTVPYLILALREEYIAPADDRPVLKAFLTVVSLGIIPILQDVGKRQQRRGFYGQLDDIADGLYRITGQKFGTDYAAWARWAVENGYSVNGENIVQHLFSGYPETRSRSREAAVRLLGYRNLDQYRQKNSAAAGKTDLDLSLFLADVLIREKILIDEKY